MYKTIAIAGTFDRLHKGHRYFIKQAFSYGEKVIIGLTSDKYLKNIKYQISKIKNTDEKAKKEKGVKDTSGVAGWSDSESHDSPDGGGISNFQKREKELNDYLVEIGLFGRAEIVKIDDVYGPAIKDNEIEALIVTSETLKGGRIVNKKRKELGLPALKIETVNLVSAEDRKRISSTRIRFGEVNREGRLNKFQISNFKFQISEELRQKLKRPLGRLISGDPQDLIKVRPELDGYFSSLNPVVVITVGDEVTRVCNEIGVSPDLAIFDFKVNRKRKYRSLEDLGYPEKGRSSYKKNSSSQNNDIPLQRCYPGPAYRQAGLDPGSIPSFNNNNSKTLGKITDVICENFILQRPELIRTVKNPPGHISRTLIEAVEQAFKSIIRTGNQCIIKIMGEDDLAGVPAILLAPLGAVVLYGQPGAGVVVVEVTEGKKSELVKILKNN